MELPIEFGKYFDGLWGFICSDYWFKTKRDLVEYYGIKNRKRVGVVFLNDHSKYVFEYTGLATKNLNETHGIKWE